LFGLSKRWLHEGRGSSFPGPIWQRNYFDRIIRNDREFSRAFVYIGRDPEEREIDGYNADRRR
jgi:hypothetical protein